MMVMCKTTKCPWQSGQFCTKLVVGIDENGMCSVLWRRGQPRAVYDTGFTPRQNIIIEEEEEHRQENLITDVPAHEQVVEKKNDEEESSVQESSQKEV